ncbi:hypothetical protein [Mesorhizobium sp. M0589]|uniref:hypothetical protein n=1 Tax=Mesorhizobium sp. M0589 TaxID=2956965 RepID=UPI0033359D31
MRKRHRSPRQVGASAVERKCRRKLTEALEAQGLGERFRAFRPGELWDVPEIERG